MWNGVHLRRFSEPCFYSTNVVAHSKLSINYIIAKENLSKKPVQKDSVGEFIVLFEGLIDSRNQAIREAHEKGSYKPYPKEWKEWAESFYVIKGEGTAASLISLCVFPNVLRNIYTASSHESNRRDFVLYKDIPLPDVIMDYRCNFLQEGNCRNIVYSTMKLSPEDRLPEGYQSVLSIPESYHTVLASPSLRIVSHVTREELFRSWKLDFHEQEKQINMLCRRNGLKRMEALMNRRKRG